MKFSTTLLCSTIAMALASGSALAESKFSLGFGLASKTNIYEAPDDDNKTLPVPVINYQSDLIYVKGLEAGLYFQPIDMLKLTGFVNIQGPAYEEDDADSLEGLDDREYTGNVGLGATVFLKIGDADFGEVAFKVMTEAGDEHEGEEADLRYGKVIMFSEQKFHIKPYFGMQFISEDKAAYNFGVTAAQQVSALAAGNNIATAYRPSDSVNTFVGIEGGYTINDKHTIVGSLESMQLDDYIADSTIVKEDAISTVSVAWLYNF
jgi:outer membrane protein